MDRIINSCRQAGWNNPNENAILLEMISAICRSAYSKELYREVQYWRGRAVAYTAVLLILCWTPTFIKGQIQFAKVIDEGAQKILPKIPVIRFEHGQITTPENKPYMVETGEPPKMIAIIDTSGKYTSLDGQEAVVLLTRDKCMLRKRDGSVQIFDLSKSKSRPLLLDQSFYSRVLRLVKLWFLPIASVLVFALSFFKRLIQAFLIGLLGLALTHALNVDLDLGELFGIATVAMTPAMILQTVVAVAGVRIPGSWILWAALIAGYDIFGINAAAESSGEH